MKNPTDENALFILGRLEGKVDAILANQHNMDKRLGEHETRLGILEQNRSWFLGASAVVASIVATAVGFFRGGQ
jgi:hypothetical protein